MVAQPNSGEEGFAPEVLAALDSARALIAAGVPVILGRPARDADGKWNPTGGAGGFVFARGWQAAEPDPTVIDKWQQGHALAAVMGHGLDLLDFDARAGGDETYRGLLTADLLPITYAEALTPSDGIHLLVKSLGVRSLDGVRAGLDVKAGDVSGVGRGLMFIAPTVRKSKTDGIIRPYVWQMPPDLDRFAKDGPGDDSGEETAEMVRQAHSATRNGGSGAAHDDPFTSPRNPLWDNPSAVIAANSRHKAVHALASALRGRGGWQVDDALAYMTETVWPLLDQERGGHPYPREEFDADVRDAFERYQDGGGEPDNKLDGGLIKVPSWPVLDRGALQGVAGQIVELIEPTTEADTAAVLACLLAAAGSWLGSDPHLTVANDRQPAVLYVMVAGGTSTGAKGTAWGAIRALLDEVDPDFVAEHLTSGLSSGEGLVERVRDESGHPEDKSYDRGIDDKRLLVVETEFASVIARMARHGATLGPILRDAWDGRPLRILNRSATALSSTGHHITVVANVTPGELVAKLDQSDLDGGTVNRFLLIMSKRSKSLPEGGNLPDEDRASIGGLLNAAKKAAEENQGQPYARTDGAMELWRRRYARLAEGLGDNRAGQATARARPQVLRLALAYALLDGQNEIGAEHIMAALKLWQYAEDSARYIFGNPDALVDEGDQASLLRFLTTGPKTRTDISDHFSRNKTAAQIDDLLRPLIKSGKVGQVRTPTLGRPKTTFYLRE